MNATKWESGRIGLVRGERIWTSSDREWAIIRTNVQTASEPANYDVYQYGVVLTSMPTLDTAKDFVEMLRGNAVIA